MHEIAPLTPDNFPQTYSLKQFLRTKELPLQHIITELGDLLGMGFGLSGNPSCNKRFAKIATGKGLCALTTSIFEEGLQIKFKNLVVGTVVADVGSWCEPDNTRHNGFKHAWNRLQFRGEPIFFSDAVHGQVNPLRNKLIFDEMTTETHYFPGLSILGWQSQITVNERLNRYFEITEKGLTAAERGEAQLLAYRARDLLAH